MAPDMTEGELCPDEARTAENGPTEALWPDEGRPQAKDLIHPAAEARIDYISVELRGHLGNVVSMGVLSLLRRYGRDITVVAALAALTISPAVGAGHCVPVRRW